MGLFLDLLALIVEELLLGSCYQEAHIVWLPALFVKEIIECKIVKETFCRVDSVTVLIVVRSIVRIRNDHHIILGGFRTHGIVADNHLPMSAPIVPANGNGVSVCQSFLNKVVETSEKEKFAKTLYL